MADNWCSFIAHQEGIDHHWYRGNFKTLSLVFRTFRGQIYFEFSIVRIVCLSFFNNDSTAMIEQYSRKISLVGYFNNSVLGHLLTAIWLKSCLWRNELRWTCFWTINFRYFFCRSFVPCFLFEFLVRDGQFHFKALAINNIGWTLTLVKHSIITPLHMAFLFHTSLLYYSNSLCVCVAGLFDLARFDCYIPRLRNSSHYSLLPSIYCLSVATSRSGEKKELTW